MSASRRSRRMRLPAVIEADGQAGGELMRPVYVGKLKSSADWARELSRLYRQMRRGEVPLAAGSRLAFVGRIAATQVRIVEELEQYRTAITEWKRMHADGAPLPEMPADPFAQIDSDDSDLLPSPTTAAEAAVMQE